jgi:hypothetical protein
MSFASMDDASLKPLNVSDQFQMLAKYTTITRMLLWPAFPCLLIVLQREWRTFWHDDDDEC